MIFSRILMSFSKGLRLKKSQFSKHRRSEQRMPLSLFFRPFQSMFLFRRADVPILLPSRAFSFFSFPFVGSKSDNKGQFIVFGNPEWRRQQERNTGISGSRLSSRRRLAGRERKERGRQTLKLSKCKFYGTIEGGRKRERGRVKVQSKQYKKKVREDKNRKCECQFKTLLWIFNETPKMEERQKCDNLIPCFWGPKKVDERRCKNFFVYLMKIWLTHSHSPERLAKVPRCSWFCLLCDGDSTGGSPL